MAEQIFVILVSNDRGGDADTIKVEAGTSLATFLNQQDVDRDDYVVAVNGRSVGNFGEALANRDCVTLTPRNVKGA